MGEADLTWATSAEIAQAVGAGRASALGVVDDALARIDERNPALNAFTAVTAERARAKARAGRRRARQGEACRLPACRSRSRTCSISQGLPTVAGSKINRARPPADARLAADRAAGSGRRGAGRRAQHGRIRLRLHRRECARRPLAQSARHHAHDRRLVRRLGRRGRRRPGAARARLRHQWLDPGAVVVVRHFRAQADLRAADARALVSLRREPRPSRARSRARRAISRSSYDAMQGPDADDAACAERAVEPATPQLDARARGPAHRGRRRLFQARRVSPRRWPRSTASPKPPARATKSKFPKRRGRAPPPMSSPPPKAPRCISTACASRRAISIPPCATA